MHTERGLALRCPIISKHWRGSCRSSSKYSHKEKKKKDLRQIVTVNVSTQIVSAFEVHYGFSWLFDMLYRLLRSAMDLQ